MLAQKTITGALGRLLWYSIVFKEHSGGEAVLVQKSTIEVLGRLCWYRRVLMEHSGGCAGTAKYYRSTGEALPVQKSTI